MNKEEIVKELNEHVKNRNNLFNVIWDTDENALVLTVKMKNVWTQTQVCSFLNFDKENFVIYGIDEDNSSALVAQNSIINEFYTKAIKLMRNYETKYTINITGDKDGYLLIDRGNYHLSLGSIEDEVVYISHFTKSEIEDMKKDPRFKGINFDKVIIEKAGKDKK